MNYIITEHAQAELKRRQITLAVLQDVLERPQQIVAAKQGRKAYQSKIEFTGQLYLVRAIVDDSVEPGVVITVYRTSKIDKYWEKP